MVAVNAVKEDKKCLDVACYQRLSCCIRCDYMINHKIIKIAFCNLWNSRACPEKCNNYIHLLSVVRNRRIKFFSFHIIMWHCGISPKSYSKIISSGWHVLKCPGAYNLIINHCLWSQGNFFDEVKAINLILQTGCISELARLTSFWNCNDLHQ